MRIRFALSLFIICLAAAMSILLLKENRTTSIITAPNMATPEMPVRLMIPKIGVNAYLEIVGLTAGREIGAPKDPANAGWFGPGVIPGNDGTAIIVGHYGWNGGRAVVFDDLNKLQKGDKIYIKDAKGTITAFVVRELRSYDEDSNVPTAFSSMKNGKAHLALITCDGVWDNIRQSYSERLVVFSDKE